MKHPLPPPLDGLSVLLDALSPVRIPRTPMPQHLREVRVLTLGAISTLVNLPVMGVNRGRHPPGATLRAVVWGGVIHVSLEKAFD